MLGRIGRFPERRRSIFQRENKFLLLNNHLRLSGNRLIHPHVFQGSFQHLSGNHRALVQGLGRSDGVSIVRCRFLSLETRPWTTVHGVYIATQTRQPPLPISKLNAKWGLKKRLLEKNELEFNIDEGGWGTKLV